MMAWAAALLALSLAWAAAGEKVVFVDNAGGSYFRKAVDGLKVPMSSSTFAATTSALLGVPPPVMVDGDASMQMEDLLVPDVFHRPRAVLLVNVAGVPEDAYVAMRTADGFMAKTPVRSFELVSGEAGALLRSAEGIRGAEVNTHHLQCDAQCDMGCQEKALLRLTGLVGAEYSPVAGEPLQGKLRLPLPEGGAEASPGAVPVEMDLSDPARRAWAVELACVLRSGMALAAAPRDPADRSLVEASIAGLEALAQAGDADALAAAARAVSVALAHVSEALQAAYGGELAAQVALLGNSAAPEMRARAAGRALLGHSGGGEGGGSERTLLQVPAAGYDTAWTHKALMFSVILIVLVAILAGMYCMCFMHFGHDTLLYGGGRKDD